MGVNRIVMQNGVVWWLPPLRSKDEQPSSPPRPSRPRKAPPPRAADPPRDAAAPPPPGFIPLSSLGIPGIDALILSHADFYREAYEKAVRKGQPGSPAPTSAAPREDGGAESPSDAPLPAPESEAGPETGEARRPAA